MMIWFAIEDNVVTRCGCPCYTGIRIGTRPIDPSRHIVRVGVAAPSRGPFVVLPSFHIFKRKIYCS